MSDKTNFDNISIVLLRPRFPENIGAAARAMCNMGIGRLVIINPENPDLAKILMMATHAASDIISKMEVRTSLKKVLSDYNYVVGTTARLGGQRKIACSPPAIMAKRLVSISLENRIAILFGPEDRGLSNDDIRYCNELVNIPTAQFSSINLAQAVMIVCHEIFQARFKKKNDFIPRLANQHELEGMYDQLKDILVRISFINPENPDYWMNNLRRFFSRLPLRSKEVKIVRGVCRQIDWYGKKCYKEGL